MNTKLSDFYYSPDTGLGGVQKMIYALKNKGYSNKEIKEFVKAQEVAQIHKNKKKPKYTHPITSPDINFIWQCDLMDIHQQSKFNSGFKWLLCCIDVFSRKAYVIPLKNKTAKKVAEAFAEILKYAKPKILVSDNGSEFISKEFAKITKKNNIEHRFSEVADHSHMGIVERFNRTIRGYIEKYKTAYGTKQWINALPLLVSNYNNSYHSGIDGIPNKPDPQKIINIYLQKIAKVVGTEQKLNIGDQVRYLLQKKTFTKGSKPNYSKNIFTVFEKVGNRYKLSNGKSYKYYELLKIEKYERNTREKIKGKYFDLEKHLKTLPAKKKVGKYEIAEPEKRKTRGKQNYYNVKYLIDDAGKKIPYI